MAVSARPFSVSAPSDDHWLRSREWDLTYISLSVVVVPIPYLIYLFLRALDPITLPLAESFGTTPDDLSRNAINFIVAILIGGPHMYATFSRTAFDHDFSATHSRLMWSSLAIPVVVLGLAVMNLPLLLTIFFFWASIHVLHQVVYITELYNHKQQSSLTPFSRMADYAVIMTALYPLGVYKMNEGNFVVGQHDVGREVENLMSYFGLSMGTWLVVLVSIAFGVSLLAWIASVVMAYQNGTLHLPKTLFIFLTVTASFFVPILGNLDTAFQGMNFWHSTQYLALTWMLNNVRQRRGELDNSPMVKDMSQDDDVQKFYWFNFRMMTINFLLGVGVFVLLFALSGQGFDYAFDRAYYVAILSVLWVHYYQDHYLFTEPDVINPA